MNRPNETHPVIRLADVPGLLSGIEPALDDQEAAAELDRLEAERGIVWGDSLAAPRPSIPTELELEDVPRLLMLLDRLLGRLTSTPTGFALVD